MKYYDLGDWVETDHTLNVSIACWTESTNDLIDSYEYKMRYRESVTIED